MRVPSFLLEVYLVLVIPAFTTAQFFHGHRRSREPRIPVITGPVGKELVGSAGLPTDFDWRNVNGQNLVTSPINQHIPHYCGACWIHAAVSVLSDRIKIARRGAYPDVQLSRQALNNCVPGEHGGPPPGCNGGDPWMVYKYMQEHPIPDETCQAWKGQNDVCQPATVCQNCVPAEVMTVFGLANQCFGMPAFTGYGVAEYGEVKGELAMMMEIYARGPIACSFVVQPDKFVMNYSQNAMLHEGVWVSDEATTFNQTDHDVEVAGWGETPSGLKYWIVRNSWGTYWADQGWFKIVRGRNSMQIEADCTWAVPTFDQLSDAMQERKVLGDYMHGPRQFSSVPMPAVGAPISAISLAAVASSAIVRPWAAVAAAGSAAGLLVMFALRKPRAIQSATTVSLLADQGA